MRRLVIAICLVALSFFLFGRQVEAGTGTTTDPAGDVFDQEAQTYGPGTLDLVSVGHSDDGSRATYVIVLKDGFDDADLHAVQIGIDGLSGVEKYDSQQVGATAFREGDEIVGKMTQSLGSGGGAEGGPGGTRELGPVTYEHAAGSDTITLSFEIGLLRAAGFTGDAYDYQVWISELGQKSSDSTSGYLRHILSAPPTPVPSAAPVAPTQPPPTPTPVSTPTVHVTATNPDRVDKDASFASPEEGSEDTFPVVPVAAGGGLVLAGAGLVAVRFWPF